MDNGGWNSVFNLGVMDIYDEGDYVAVYEKSEHIASFKNLDLAKDFTVWYYNRD